MAQTYEYQVINAPAANISTDLDRFVVAGWRPILMNTITLRDDSVHVFIMLEKAISS
jgi:hypothetical protein